MNFIKKYIPKEGSVSIERIKWIFGADTDSRVVSAAYRIKDNDEHGFPVYVNAGAAQNEDYRIIIEPDRIEIYSDGAAGAFYALVTLGNFIKQSSVLECCEIYDAPDMSYRGFYQDITRGKIPKLETLKNLADTLAEYKINSLQLYVEHAFEFEEYASCRDRLGYMSKEEMKELDRYCHERFIELVPSLSCFGHLYHLLSIDKYKHLAELRNCQPKHHYWYERMKHHTINPLCEESFELIKSLIDRYIPCFMSDKFNICCDETFDLGTDVNKGRDKAEMYTGFVKKLIAYLQGKGKTVMMWGDIILNHPEKLAEIPKDVIMLNWDYEPYPNENNVKLFAEKMERQIVCSGSWSWNNLSENVNDAERNIDNLTAYGYKYGAEGILHTNWGDYGNLCSLEMAHYSLICSAARGWNKEIKLTDKFRKDVSLSHYGNEQAVGLIAEFGEISEIADWEKIILHEKQDTGEAEYLSVIEKCYDIHKKAEKLNFFSEDMKEELIAAADGYALFAKWNAAQNGIKTECYVNSVQWIEQYKKRWLKKNKPQEVSEAVRLFEQAEEMTMA